MKLKPEKNIQTYRDRDKDREKLQFFVRIVLNLVNLTFNLPFINSLLSTNMKQIP